MSPRKRTKKVEDYATIKWRNDALETANADLWRKGNHPIDDSALNEAERRCVNEIRWQRKLSPYHDQ